MSFALVGSLGAVNVTASNTANTPSWDAGASRIAGNLLLCWVVGHSANTLPTTPTGWSIAAQKQGTSCSATLYYLVAAGADAAPTIGAKTGTGWDVMLAEYSGNAGTPLDQAATDAGVASPRTATAGGADVAAGELLVYASGTVAGTSFTVTTSDTLNNGASSNDRNNDATSTFKHYRIGYGITTGNGSADSDTFAFSGGTFVGAVLAIASFRLAGAPPADNRRVRRNTLLRR